MATTTTRNRKPKTSRKATKRRSASTLQTKAGTILELLRRPTGALIAELTKATDWQAHSIRAALTGLRKKGNEVVRVKDDQGVTRYRIAEETAS
jgi:hypothetical protein